VSSFVVPAIKSPFFLSANRVRHLAYTAPITAPSQPFALGSEVGVPTGTTLTNTTGLPAADATETLGLVHPVTGVTTIRTVSVWRRRRWTAVFSWSPSVGQTYLFDQCEFDVPNTSWTIEVDQTNGTNDLMQPLAVFRRCTFDGNDDSSISLAANFAWVMNCHIVGAEDGLHGGAYTVVMDSNVMATSLASISAHCDGFQCSGTGQSVVFHNWISAGSSPGRSSALRFGNEDGAVTNVYAYYNGLDNGGWCFQCDGSFGAGNGITDVKVRGNRWTTTAAFGPVDFTEAADSEWVDNRYFDGTVIPAP
jgi:hypothetical protein